MKIPFLLSIAALVSVTLAQTASEEPRRDAVAETIEQDYNLTHDDDHHSDFTAWSSPGYKGHRQRTKGTPGCYRLDGGAVGSYTGPSDSYYVFHGGDHCRGKVLYGPRSAPVKNIDPVIYPRSVKIRKHDRPPTKYSVVLWSRRNYSGYRQKIDGLGCYGLDGSRIKSIQGTNRYRFYDGERCYGARVAEHRGPQNNIPAISPKSIYVY
ncbi:hypothetical protein BG004_002295 [Podila humilis]|nr:hypothetical protein BG004_002295 [Podila humilis]